jgi:hypothetical protein
MQIATRDYGEVEEMVPEVPVVHPELYEYLGPKMQVNKKNIGTRESEEK